MKTKKFRKKLSLNKSTVSNLDGKAMRDAHGGGTWIYCPTGMTDCFSECVTGCPLCPSMDTTCTTEDTLDQNTCFHTSICGC
jgi:hypothetical protein